MKFIITEKQYDRIIKEQSLLDTVTSVSDVYSAMLGYLDSLDSSWVDDYGPKKVEMLNAKKEVKIYWENKRDNKSTKELSTPESKALFNTIAKLVNESPNLEELINQGKKIKTNQFT